MNEDLLHLQSQLAWGSDDDLRFGLSVSWAKAFNFRHKWHSVDNFSEDDMLAVQPAAFDSGDEELWAIGVGSSVGHGEESYLVVLQLEVLISEFGSVDRFSSSAVVVGEVSSLEHELGDDSVEAWSGIAEALLTSAESSEVLSSLGDYVLVEFEGDSACGSSVNGDVKIALGVGFGHQVYGKILNIFWIYHHINISFYKSTVN